MAVDLQSALLGGAIATLGIALFIVLLVVLIALYVYFAMALMTIAKKLKHKRPWLAWIPFANIVLVLQLGGFHWAWVFLILIPILGFIIVTILLIIAFWRIFERRKYPGWLALVAVLSIIPVNSISGIASIAFLVIIGIVAWKDN
jgi:hypothetical protein